MASRYRSENREIMAGRVLPKSQGDGSRFEAYQARYRTDVAAASKQLLIRMLKFGADNHGLPNMTPGMCRAQLNAIADDINRRARELCE